MKRLIRVWFFFSILVYMDLCYVTMVGSYVTQLKYKDCTFHDINNYETIHKIHGKFTMQTYGAARVRETRSAP